MSQIKQIDFFRVLSIVGYSMLPMVGLASLSIAVNLRGYLGLVVGLSANRNDWSGGPLDNSVVGAKSNSFWPNSDEFALILPSVNAITLPRSALI